MKYLISNNNIARLNNRLIFKFRGQDQIIFQETNTSLNIATIFHWMWLFFLYSSLCYIHVLNFNVVESIDHFLEVHRNSFLYSLIKLHLFVTMLASAKQTNKQIQKQYDEFSKTKEISVVCGCMDQGD